MRRLQPLLAMAGAAMMAIAQLAAAQTSQPAGTRPNILLITADDMNWDSPSCCGNPMADITPNIDRLAAEGLRFTHAHVTSAVCTPCRSVLLTGLYPHHSGVEGFQRVRSGVPTLPAVLRQAGYLCGTVGKWLGQQETFQWTDYYTDTDHGREQLFGRNPEVYHHFSQTFFEKARRTGKPFFLMANSHDPHRPFHGSKDDQRRFHTAGQDAPAPSHIYQPEQVRVPGFLPDLPDIRTELAQFYSSVRRCDDTVGAILRALTESGLEDHTLVIFLSDNGMSFPFAKTNCYLNSTRTPWIVRWPGRVRPGSVDRQHLISTLDFMPTVLEAAGIPLPVDTDGQSLLPLLGGQTQTGRDLVFTQFHHIHGVRPYPMRCVQDRRYGYIFNPWADGKRVYDAEPLSDLTFAAMQKNAETDPAIQRRVHFLQYRCVEEFYDFQTDPNALTNRIDDPSIASEVQRLRKELLNWMIRTRDPALEAFRLRNSPEALDQFMREYSTKAAREIEDLKPYEEATGYHF